MRKKLSKILLTDVAEQIKPVYKTNCSRTKNFDRRTQTSVPKKFLQTGKNFLSQKTRTSRFGTKRSWKGIQENTSLSDIYWRFYWPGSYAPRGVIDQYICLQMGLPFFSWLYYRRKLKEFVKLFSIKANRIYKKTAEDVPDLFITTFYICCIMCWKF